LEIHPFLSRNGRIDEALEILNRDLESPVVPIYDVLALDPRLERQRQDARFKPLLARYCENCIESMRTLAQIRARGELPGSMEAPFENLLKKLDMKL